MELKPGNVPKRVNTSESPKSLRPSSGRWRREATDIQFISGERVATVFHPSVRPVSLFTSHTQRKRASGGGRSTAPRMRSGSTPSLLNPGNTSPVVDRLSAPSNYSLLPPAAATTTMDGADRRKLRPRIDAILNAVADAICLASKDPVARLVARFSAASDATRKEPRRRYQWH